MTVFVYFPMFVLKLIKILASITQWYSQDALPPLHPCHSSNTHSFQPKSAHMAAQIQPGLAHGPRLIPLMKRNGNALVIKYEEFA